MTKAWGGLGLHSFHKRTEIASELHELVQAVLVFPGQGKVLCQCLCCRVLGVLGVPAAQLRGADLSTRQGFIVE